MSKIAWVAGASGLVGQQIVEQLTQDSDFSICVVLECYLSF